MLKKSVVIVGGGASGALLAVNLSRRTRDVHAIVIEPRESLGKGTAYSTGFETHLLNVPASRMSAFPGDPNHFVDWLEEHHRGRFAPHSFVQRSVYGEYLNDIVLSAAAAAGPRFTHVRATAENITVSESGALVRCSNGDVVKGAFVVLASGNVAPAPWHAGRSNVSAMSRFFASAWDSDALMPEDPNGAVVLIGTGLTAIDAALGLRENNHRGPIHMISRHGLIPHEHRLPTSSLPPLWNEQNQRGLLHVARSMKRNGLQEKHWRLCVDSVRPYTNDLWKALPLTDRKRFVRHLMPYWNVHRHRMAPEITQMVAGLIASNTLYANAGQIGSIVESDESLLVPVRLRNTGRNITIIARRVINCSGPLQDYKKAEDPLFRSLLSEGSIIPSSLGIGIEVAPNGAVVGADNLPSASMFAIGPMRFGSLIETTAMPEIRSQARDLAAHLAALLSRTEGSPQ